MSYFYLHCCRWGYRGAPFSRWDGAPTCTNLPTLLPPAGTLYSVSISISRSLPVSLNFLSQSVFSLILCLLPFPQFHLHVCNKITAIWPLQGYILYFSCTLIASACLIHIWQSAPWITARSHRAMNQEHPFEFWLSQLGSNKKLSQP